MRLKQFAHKILGLIKRLRREKGSYYDIVIIRQRDTFRVGSTATWKIANQITKKLQRQIHKHGWRAEFRDRNARTRLNRAAYGEV